MTKNFVLDTNCLLEDEHAIEVLKNGKNGKDRNNIFIPRVVLDELDGLKKEPRLRHRVNATVRSILKHKDEITVLGEDSLYLTKPDDEILTVIKDHV